MPSMDPLIEVFAVPGVSIDVRAHYAMKCLIISMTSWHTAVKQRFIFPI